jgi:cyclic dehypoxanthinyl futalosine synthase
MKEWEKILTGQLTNNPIRLTVKEAIILYNYAEINDLMDAALFRRRKMLPGNKITYLVDRNINYTNICTINCQFCSFYRPPGHPETYTQTFAQISTRISELENINGSRILMQGGVNPELGLEWYVDLIKSIRLNHPTIDLDCFSPIEIEGIAEVCNLETLAVLEKMKNAGLHGLPGGGAEMLVDDVRLDISPKKGSSQNWLRIMEEAQSLGLVTSATNVIGFGEKTSHRVYHMDKIRQSQDKAIKNGYNGFTSFISWPVQLENNVFGKRNKGNNKIQLEITPQEYLRHVAISRLFFDNIQHIQASWPTMGLGIAQMAFFAGADDAGSTMMEENVVSASGTQKTNANEIELQKTISRAGFIPQKRNSEYEFLPTIIDVEENISASIPMQN